MEIVVKTAWNPNTEQEYEVELPAPNLVENALLETDYPPGGLHKKKIAEMLAQQFALTDEQKTAKHKSGFRLFNYHVGRVTGVLIRSGKMMKPKTGWRDINRGQTSERIEETQSAFDGRVDISAVPSEPNSKFDKERISGTPDKFIEENYRKIRDELAAELLTQIKGNTPAFFENLVIDLLVKMGYGGSREDAGRAVGRSGDGGIDGIINEDRLGLDVIYVQAKRWDEGNVGEPDIARFAGALAARGANKGVFITTSNFTKAARAYSAAGFKIILIDGNQLAQLMIDHNVGVSIEKTYEIKRVDSDYFAEDAN